MEDPYYGETLIDENSLAGFEQLCKLAFEKKREVKAKKLAHTECVAEFESLKAKVLSVLDKHKIDKFNSKNGLVYRTSKLSVKVPKTEAEKEAVFEYFKARGLFYKYASVNSTSLNSYFNEQNELALERGEVFSMPGIGASAYREGISFRGMGDDDGEE